MIGFVPLCEAADAIGHEVYGTGWRPIQEIGTDCVPSDEELIVAGFHLLNADGEVDPDAAKHARSRFASNRRAQIIIGRMNQEIEQLICSFAERAESGEIETWYRSIKGVDPLDRGEWRASNWRGYFVDGEIELPLPLLDGNSRPTGDGRTARCRRAIFVRQRDVDRLIEALPLPVLLAHTKLRHPTDAPLIQEGLQALKRGEATSPLQAAKLVVERAQGPSFDANLDRLRKAITAEQKARAAK